MAMTDLSGLARQARTYALTMIYHAGSGHPGGSLSAIDLLCYLYFRELNYAPDNPARKNRDRLILSKGHACPALYAVACLAGLVPKTELSGFRKIDRNLQGHPHVGTTPWVETSTGSLGQGFSVAAGIALGLRHLDCEARTYAIIGDGEVQEGQIWEGAMFAAHHRLHRLCAILDYNKMQSDDLNRNIMEIEPLADKWRSFGWCVHEIDGHDYYQMERAFSSFHYESERPTLILAHTLKGKGVSYMEGLPNWHGSLALGSHDLKRALGDLGLSRGEIETHLDGRIWEAE